MLNNSLITVYEHQALVVGQQYEGTLFTEAHWLALVAWHPSLPHPYYTLTHRGIKLSHYVGVLITPTLTLEILPKADAHHSPKAPRWRQLLVAMLAECQYLRPNWQQTAASGSSSNTLLDIFLLDFLAEVAHLCQRGLVKQYRSVEENSHVLKGQLLFAQHIRHNAVHQEKFFVRHSAHTPQHHLHQLLKRALLLVLQASSHPMVQQQASQLQSFFTHITEASDATLLATPLRYNRQTASYWLVATFARQLLEARFSNLYPGIGSSVSTLLLDMNLLFEEFVYQRLRKLAPTHGWIVHRQTARPLWGETKVRPDIVVEFPTAASSIVIDTKWKVMTKARPAAKDLHQLYVYNQLFGAKKGILLYPKVYDLPMQRRQFDGPYGSHAEISYLVIASTGQPGLNPQLNEQLIQLVLSADLDS